MTTLLSFLFTLAVLIIVHEFGHYAVARACGVRVLRFSVGFGRVIASRRDRLGTEWALSAVPLGGYVKMLDEREEEVAVADLPYAFNRKGVWQRIAIVVAGPAANLLLAIALFWSLYATGVPALKPFLGEPPAGTQAAVAGLQAGEEVLSINGEKVAGWQELHFLVLRHGYGQELQLETRDPAGHLNFRRLDLSAIDREAFETNPLTPLGLTRYNPPIEPVIGEVVPGGVAERAGLQDGDRLLAAAGTDIYLWEEAVKTIRGHPDRPLDLLLLRDGREIALTLVPEAVEQAGERIGRIGAAPRLDPALFEGLQTELRYPLLPALRHAVQKTWDLSVFSLQMLGRMIVGQASLQNLSGPLSIADYAGQSASAGVSSFLTFLALISISLGVLNLLPVPLLDGGHLLYYLAELVTGRPVPERIQEFGQKIGIMLLASLMFLALYNDILRLFSR